MHHHILKEHCSCAPVVRACCHMGISGDARFQNMQSSVESFAENYYYKGCAAKALTGASALVAGAAVAFGAAALAF